MIDFGDCPAYMVELLAKNMFDEMFKVMVESFPADEYRPREKQLALLDDENYKVYCSRDKDGKLAVFIACWNWNDLNFLEHFAVRKDLRGEGLGGTFLDRVVKSLSGRICLETEPPEDEICRRRIAFYERHAFFLNSYDYLQPPLSPACAPKKLLLMTYGGRAEKNVLDEIVRTIHTRAFCTYKYLKIY